MDKEKLYNLISNPEQTSPSDQDELFDLLKLYPYFQSVHQLLLYNLKTCKSDKYEQQLKASAIHIADRKVLYNLLHGTKQIVTNPSIRETSATPAVEPISKDLLEIDENAQPNNPNIEEVIESVRYDEAENLSREIEFEIESNPASSGMSNLNAAEISPSFDLIDKFIESPPSFVPRKLDINEEVDDISTDSIKEPEDLISETLATIYISQKLYDKATQVYEKLILKFPEKNAYFANRIKELQDSIK